MSKDYGLCKKCESTKPNNKACVFMSVRMTGADHSAKPDCGDVENFYLCRQCYYNFLNQFNLKKY